MSGKLDEFTQLMRKQSKSQIPVQTEWCTVKEVDWEDKTMTVESLVNGLDYFDVLLGLGSIYKKPAPGTKVLIGLIANTEACFMLDAEVIEEVEIVDESGFKINLSADLLTINGDELGGIVKAKELKTQVDKNTAILQALQNAISSWTPIPEDGGSAFKAQLANVPGMQRANLSNIENEKIKHG